MQPQQHGNSMESNLSLIEKIVESDNLNKAFKRVKSNKGAAGVDAKDIEATRLYLKEEGQMIIELIKEGKYKPQPVRRVEIPMPTGGKRWNPYRNGQSYPASHCTETYTYFRKTV